MKYFVLCLALSVMFLVAPAPAEAQHAVGFSWVAGSGGGTPTGFHVYRTLTSGGCSTVTATGCSNVGSTASTVTTFSDTTVLGSQTYFWVVTAFNTTGESGPSNQVTATIPPDAATPPTGLTITSVK